MQRLRWTILFSLAIHFLIFAVAALFFYNPPHEAPNLSYLEFDLVSLPEPAPPENPPRPRVIVAAKPPEIPETHPAAAETVFVMKIDSNLADAVFENEDAFVPDFLNILTGNTEEQREKLIRQSLLQNSLKENVFHKLDSIQTRQKIIAARFSRFLMNSDQLKQMGTKRNAFSSNQTARSLGANPGMVNLPGLIAGIGRSLANAIGKREQKPVVGGAVGLPTLMEIEVLNNLWKKGEVTDLNLYAVLDTTYRITNTDFNRILEVMASKGWVRREKISPENIFTITTPLGGIPIEMSAKNRRNPVYAYRPVLGKAAVMRALNLAIFNLEDSTGIGAKFSGQNQPFAKESINRKIFKLLEN